MTALVLVIVLALVFDFINGFHDAANSIATVVSTRVLSPNVAVIWAATFNFVAFLVFSTHVAGNIAKGIDPAVVTLGLVTAGLVGAVIWDLLTWWWGLPTSSSHALLGGLAGAALVKAGAGALDLPFFGKTALFILLSPLIGLVLGFAIMKLTMALFGQRSPRTVDWIFRRGQLVSAALYSLGHGGNDAQKTMGIIVAALLANQVVVAAPKGEPQPIPLWVVLACHAAMGLGTLSGGWRIVKTMGMKITKLAPVGGFAAESAGAATLFTATALGIPVSTTHTITGAIVGVGSVRKLSAVRWGVAQRIVWSWVLTVPGAAAIGALAFVLMRALGIPV
ncbi:MAG: anion permease [Myxococcales bacterium 68-20]|nr:inorganic phosphate transporter [Myxococcales bacterium]OJY19983.1 MAG: anion permease [Myxococcales bacterium 68-20]